MKIAVWRSGHIIADTVAEAVYEGLRSNRECELVQCVCSNGTSEYEADVHIGYGILRGMGEVFRRARTDGKPFFIIDRGYWKPNHYDGYYRISLNGTQQTFGFDKLEPDYERWEKLGIEIRQPEVHYGKTLYCPPTDYVKQFFGLNGWEYPIGSVVREKGCLRELQDDLDLCKKVVTFNSSVGWEALRQGIPVVSDPQHSIVGSYQKWLDKNIHTDLDERRKFFAMMAGLQLSLEEIRSGKLWPLLTKPLSL